jgi:hypothetical protein
VFFQDDTAQSSQVFQKTLAFFYVRGKPVNLVAHHLKRRAPPSLLALLGTADFLIHLLLRFSGGLQEMTYILKRAIKIIERCLLAIHGVPFLRVPAFAT